MTCGETSPASAWPAAICNPVRNVAWTSAAGTTADAVAGARASADKAADRATPRSDSRLHPAQRQPFAEQLAGSGQSSGDGPLGPAELSCRFFVSQTLEIAEDDRPAILRGQPLHFLVEQWPQFAQ